MFKNLIFISFIILLFSCKQDELANFPKECEIGHELYGDFIFKLEQSGKVSDEKIRAIKKDRYRTYKSLKKSYIRIKQYMKNNKALTTRTGTIETLLMLCNSMDYTKDEYTLDLFNSLNNMTSKEVYEKFNLGHFAYD